MSGSAVGWLAVTCALALVASALLHALIAAFDQLPKADERALADARRPDGRRTLGAWLARDPEHTANSASVAYAVTEPIALVAWAFIAADVGARLGLPWLLAALGAAVVGAFFSLVVVRATPRQLARSYPLGTVRVVGPVAAPLVAASAPIRAVIPALRRPPLAEAQDVVDQAEDVLEPDDVELVRSVVNLGETLVREVMVPRTDMITVASGTDVSSAMRLFLRSGRSRMPVVGAGVDDMIGVVYLKDLLAATWDRPGELSRPVDHFARPAVFIPESVKVDDLLRTMQRDASHIAIVVDEFGGVAGLVTIEDAIEEIVGELQDEHDAAEPEPIALQDGAYRVPARLPLDELAALFDLDIDDEDVETVAGLLTKALGQVPIAGSRAESHGLELVADAPTGRRKRLAWVVVRPAPSDAEDEA